jgi:PAS domain S-box-containing protein
MKTIPVQKLENSVQKFKENIASIGLSSVAQDAVESYIEGLRREISESISTENKPVNDKLKEIFRDFTYYPGIVLAFDRSHKVVFQNKPILAKANIVGQRLEDILQFLDNPGLINEISQVWELGEVHKVSMINPVNLKMINVHLNRYQVEKEFFLLAFLEGINLPDNNAVIPAAQESRLQNNTTIIDKYRLIANSISDIFFILDRDLKFTFVAPSIERTLDYSYNELVGRGFDVLIPEWSGNTLKKNLDTVLALRPDISEPQRFTIQLSGKYGRLNWYEVQITGIYDAKSNLQGFNGVCRDITERLKYEEALRLAKKKAEESDRLKSAFLANMSHEIRTPLNGIIGFSTMLTNKYMPDEKKERYADYIISSSKQLLTLISDIIDISKIEAGQLSIFKTQIDIRKILKELDETISFERDRLEKYHVDIELKYPVTEELIFVSDEIRLKQVMINLLSNALKFTNEGKIRYGCELVNRSEIKFFVKDSGSGIPQNLQKTVFERFRQGEADRSAKVAGTGLGLAISKGLIGLMDGQIGVKSQKGLGSEFYFTLPYTKEF